MEKVNLFFTVIASITGVIAVMFGWLDWKDRRRKRSPMVTRMTIISDAWEDVLRDRLISH